MTMTISVVEISGYMVLQNHMQLSRKRKHVEIGQWGIMTKYEYETLLEARNRIMAINMLAGRSCMNCDWLRGHDMKCQKRVIFPSYEYGELPEEMICNDWKERFS